MIDPELDLAIQTFRSMVAGIKDTFQRHLIDMPDADMAVMLHTYPNEVAEMMLAIEHATIEATEVSGLLGQGQARLQRMMVELVPPKSSRPN